MRTKVSDRAAAAVMTVGFVAVWALTNRLRTRVWLQDLLAGSVGRVVLPIAAATVLGALFYWAWPRQRRAYLWSVLVSGTLSMGTMFYAERVGWLAGTTFRPPVWFQCCVYGLAVMGMVALNLGLYRLLARVSKILALAVYLGWVAIFSALTVPAEHVLLANGGYVMSHGYTIFWDVLWGIVLYLIGLGLYLALDRRSAPIPDIPSSYHAPPATTAS